MQPVARECYRPIAVFRGFSRTAGSPLKQTSAWDANCLARPTPAIRRRGKPVSSATAVHPATLGRSVPRVYL